MKKIIFIILFLLAVLGSIFFFVAREMTKEKGVLNKLPPYQSATDALDSEIKINQQNILKILVNNEGITIIREKKIPVEEVRAYVKKFILNPEQESDFAKRPQEAMISLGNERNAPYEKYLETYNEIKGAYSDLWDLESRKQFGKDYEHLNKEEKRSVRLVIPMVISEAEPTDF